MKVHVRRYEPGEEAAIWSVYFGSTRHIVAREYTDDQVRRWAPVQPDTQAWARRLAERNPFVADIDGQIVGFAELEPNGHIDYFYCHQDFQRQGIGTRLLAAVEEEARRSDLQELFAEVSLTGVGFFRASGFVVVDERTNVVCNAPAKQFLMRKCLEP